MISLEAALERILPAVKPLPKETIPLISAPGRWLAEDVYSPIELPPFDNSAMDGYAVAAAEVAGASSDNPVNLRCEGETAAGQPPGPALPLRNCRRIFTGAPLPAGADAVVMQEDTRISPDDPDQVWVLDAPKPWEHIRFRGEDLKAGARLASRGQRLNFSNLTVLAATGFATVEVGNQPVVGLIATGDELAEPGAALMPGGIYESNRLMLATLVRETGGLPRVYPIVRDTLAATESALVTAAAKCDVVITSGGVSVGAYDHVKDAVLRLGGDLDFWQVAIRPGKPFVWGSVKERHFVGLPGNPISCLVTFLLLVRPALIRLQGGGELMPDRRLGRLTVPIRNPGPRRHFMRACLNATGDVRIVGLQGSHILSGLMEANALLDVPPAAEWEAGREVSVLLFP